MGADGVTLDPATLHAYQTAGGAPDLSQSASAVTQSWMLPLSWVGATVTAVSISPNGEVPGQSTLLIDGRILTIMGVIPGWPVRLTRA